MQINLSKCKIAIITSLNNTEGLIIDATILEKNDRLSRSFTLFHLAIEELITKELHEIAKTFAEVQIKFHNGGAQKPL